MPAIEARLLKLEEEQRRRMELRYPSRIGVVMSDDFSDEAELLAAIAAEHATQGTRQVVKIEFVDAEDGREVPK